MSSNSPEISYVIDLEGLVEAYGPPANNYLVAELTKLMSSDKLLSTTSVRKRLKEYNSSIANSVASNGMRFKAVDRRLNNVAHEMLTHCHEIGVDVSDRGISLKIYLVALAKSLDCSVVSNDDRPTKISMRYLCDLFDVGFVPLSSL
jgi:hypothetical protein